MPSREQHTDGSDRDDGGVQVLDATCGTRSMWLPGQKEREDVLYLDKRKEREGFSETRGTVSIQPDMVEDFRDLPFEDDSFDLAVFDPPHVVSEDGQEHLSGHVMKCYGSLRAETWQADIRAGFEELFRVLRPGGTLVFKFADNDVPFREVLDLAPHDPLFGTTTRHSESIETRWFAFRKPRGNDGV